MGRGAWKCEGGGGDLEESVTIPCRMRTEIDEAQSEIKLSTVILKH